MHAALVERMEPAALPEALPIRITQRASRASSGLMLAIVLPVAVAFLYPFVLIAIHLASDAGMRAAALGSSSGLPAILIGFAFWIVLFAWPLKRIVESFAERRTITIADGDARVTEVTLFGTRSWRAPLTAFTGLAHHVRSSLSGCRHELLLVHPDSDKVLLVAIAPRIAQVDIDRACGILGCAEISSREAFTLPTLLGLPSAFRRAPTLSVSKA